MNEGIDPRRLREVETFDDVLDLLADELDWPLGDAPLEEAAFEYEPGELGIPPEQVPQIRSLRQLRPLTLRQPWGIFFIEFSGPRLPVGALRRLLRSLVTRKRNAPGTHPTWDRDDLLFVTLNEGGDGADLHLVAFAERVDRREAEIRSLPWSPRHSPDHYLARLARDLLPRLAWPADSVEPATWRRAWREAFVLRHGAALRSAQQLTDRMAETATVLRARISDAIAAEAEDGPLRLLMAEMREELVADLDDERFADMCAQTLTYGALTARIIDPEAFGASPVLSSVPLANPFLSAFFERVHDEVLAMESAAAHLEALVADLRATQVEAVLDQFGNTARGGDPVIHLYESFLAAYDPRARAEAGAFYTPRPVVACIVRLVDDALRSAGLADGLADEATWGDVSVRIGESVPAGVDPEARFVSALDPATGTGTFLVELIRRTRADHAQAASGQPWQAFLTGQVIPGLTAFELMLAPYAIAHLKVAIETGADAADALAGRILLTDTLELPGPTTRFEQLDPVAREGQRAAAFKRDGRPTVIVSNPPYRRVARADAGGWVAHGDGHRPALIEDILEVANQTTIFSHVANLYNLYVYFWRWAIWKAFEQPGHGFPAVVGFITASSWLDGPGFVGLREAARTLCTDVWIVDLAGDNRGTQRDENVFDIETPVAIAILVRTGRTDADAPARILYRRVWGTRTEKLRAVDEIRAPAASEDGAWTEVGSASHAILKPPSGDLEWTSMPALTDLFPWQQPGAMLNRTWPVAPDSACLLQRWQAFLAAQTAAERAALFPNPRSGRTVDTNVQGLPSLASLTEVDSPQPIAAFQWRAFDRQWIFDDPRLAALERPALWQSVGPHQVFMATLASEPIGPGPALAAFTAVPDKHVFRGSFGGKDIIPLYRDEGGRAPNVAAGLANTIGAALAIEPPTPEDLAAYVMALLSTPGYQARFTDELLDKVVRVPMTGDAALFAEAVSLGREVLWLQTMGQRIAPAKATGWPPPGRSSWARPVTRIPESGGEIQYEEETGELLVGDGVIVGVPPDVWEYQVSGWPVVQRWLEHRTRRGRGRKSSELDDIRPDRWHPEWSDELIGLLRVLERAIALEPQQDDLLARVCEGPLLSADDLPTPSADERKVPPTLPRTPTQGRLM